MKIELEYLRNVINDQEELPEYKLELIFKVQAERAISPTARASIKHEFEDVQYVDKNVLSIGIEWDGTRVLNAEPYIAQGQELIQSCMDSLGIK